MKINRKLNLVLTIENDEGKPVSYVHSTPVGQAIFEHHFFVLSRTYASFLEQGEMWFLSQGPRVAALQLRRVAEEAGSWAGEGGIEKGFLGEVKRLTNVITPDVSGWDAVPYETAVAQGILSPEDASEVLNAVAFFTVCSAAMKTGAANESMERVFSIFGAETTFSNCMEYKNSLPTLTPPASTGESMNTVSVPV